MRDLEDDVWESFTSPTLSDFERADQAEANYTAAKRTAVEPVARSDVSRRDTRSLPDFLAMLTRLPLLAG